MQSSTLYDINTMKLALDNTFPEMTRMHELLKEYGQASGVDIMLEKLTDGLGKKLFTVILRDFKSSTLSVDELSSLCELMYGKFSLSSDLHDLLLNGAEIEWDIRHEPAAAADSITELLEYFRQ